MVQGQEYKVGALKLINQILSIFDGLPKMCGVVVMEDDAFSIDQFWLHSFDCLAYSFQLLIVVVDSD